MIINITIATEDLGGKKAEFKDIKRYLEDFCGNGRMGHDLDDENKTIVLLEVVSIDEVI